MLIYQFLNKSDLFLTDTLIIYIYIWNITTFLSFNNLRQTKCYDYTLAVPPQFLELKCHVNYLIRFNFTLFNLSLHNISGSWRGTPCLRKVWGAWSRWPLKRRGEDMYIYIRIFIFPEPFKILNFLVPNELQKAYTQNTFNLPFQKDGVLLFVLYLLTFSISNFNTVNSK